MCELCACPSIFEGEVYIFCREITPGEPRKLLGEVRNKWWGSGPVSGYVTDHPNGPTKCDHDILLMVQKSGKLTSRYIYIASLSHYWRGVLYFPGDDGRISSINTSWWLNQSIWNILVKLGSFPQVGMNIKNIWNHQLKQVWILRKLDFARRSLHFPQLPGVPPKRPVGPARHLFAAIFASLTNQRAPGFHIWIWPKNNISPT